MARVRLFPAAAEISISAAESASWATGWRPGGRSGGRWPCSALAGRRIFARFDAGGLVDLSVGGRLDVDAPAGELSAMVADFADQHVPRGHVARRLMVDRHL